MQKSRGIILLLWLFPLAVGGLLGHPVWGQTQAAAGPLPDGSVIEYHQKDRTLTIHVTAVPLRQLLETVTAQTHIQFQPPDPDTTFDDRPVTCSFNRMELEQAIRQLLGPSNTAMIYSETPSEAGQRDAIRLAEVKVISLGIIPVTATPSPAGGIGAGSVIPSGPRTFARPERAPSNRNGGAAGDQRPQRPPRGPRGGRAAGDSANNGYQQSGPGQRQHP